MKMLQRKTKAVKKHLNKAKMACYFAITFMVLSKRTLNVVTSPLMHFTTVRKILEFTILLTVLAISTQS